MVDAGQVAQVEDVMELGGSGWQVLDNLVVQFQCGSGDERREILQL